MRFIFLIILISVSCERKNTITPISESKDIKKKISKSYTIRYPLMPEEVGEYNYGEVIEMDPKRRNLIQNITKPFKEMLYGFVGVKLLNKNKIKAQATFDVPREVFQHIKSVKIKRIFFILDTCVDQTERCTYTVIGNVKTDFIKGLFVNLEPLKSDSKIENFKEINEITYQLEAERSIRTFGLKDRWEREDILQIAQFSKRKSNLEDYRNFYVFKERENINHLSSFLKNSPHVKSTTSFGDLILAEIHNTPNYSITGMMYEQSFIREFKNTYNKIKPVSCSVGNCTELNINSENLMDYLKRNPEVIINTYIKIGELPNANFSYKGFIEFDVELKI